MPTSVHSFLSTARPPPLFYPCLAVFNLFPLHMPITLVGIDAPYGRFSSSSSGWLYVNGNVAWALAEIFAPATYIYTLITTSHRPPTPVALLLTTLYFIHYAHRAILSPLVLSPKRSRQHILVTVSMAAFNLFNGYLLGCWINFFPPRSSLIDKRVLLACLGWLVGFAGNVYHDEVLNDLRRHPSERTVSSLTKEEEEGDKRAASANTRGSGRYLIPRAGLFRFISSPNYLCEIIEWTSFALVAVPISPNLPLSHVFLTPLPPLNGTIASVSTSYPALGRLMTSVIPEAAWPTAVLAPPFLFAVNTAANLLPRAMRGLAWNRETFGERFPKERKALIPFLL